MIEQAEVVRTAVAAERNNGSSPLKLAILDHKRRFLEMEQEWLADVIAEHSGEGEDSGVEAGRTARADGP